MWGGRAGVVALAALAALAAVAALTVHVLAGGAAGLTASAPAPGAPAPPATKVPTPASLTVAPRDVAPPDVVPSGAAPSRVVPSSGGTARPAVGRSPSSAAVSPRARELAVRRAVAAALRGRRGTVDLAVGDVGGAQLVHAGAGVPVRTASIVKLLVLRSLQSRGPLTPAQRVLATRMITKSDNDATTRLWRASGRDAGIARAAGALGMTRTRRVPVLLMPWDGWATTAEDQVRLLRAVGTGRSAADAFTRSLMARVVPSQRWGVGAIAGATGVKNGWLPVAGRWVVNTDGCVERRGVRLCVSVLSTGSRSQREGIRAVEAAAAAAVRAWTR